MKLQEGDKAPLFKLPNADGIEVALKDLNSKTVVLYFYPKDNTPGCSIEALDFTEALDAFAQKNAVIVGISPDSPASHKKFIRDKALKHVLLSDEDKSVATSYGAYGTKIMYGKETMGIIRSTFIIDETGHVRKAFYNVRAKGHAQKVLENL